MVCQNDARDTSERLFGVNSVESTVVGESCCQQGVRISKVVKVGEVKFLLESVLAPQIPRMSYSAESPAKGKRKKSATPASVVPKRRVEFDDESVKLPKVRGVYFDVPNFGIALKNQVAPKWS